MTLQTARTLCWLLLSVGAAVTAAAGDEPVATPTPDPLRFEAATEVVASRVVDEAAAAGRREVVVTREEIAALPVATVQDLLAVIPGVGLARRGARGVQGDLNLRGGTFEQALVLVNGVRVNNPQTGHHHLDLFIPLAAVERVEVLYGSGSAVHGSDAFGGAVNIVTAAPAPELLLRAGEHHLWGGAAAGALANGLWAAAEREVHTGFQDGTEADANQLAGGWSWRDGGRSLDLLLSGGERDFGAYKFYSAAYPDQHESTAGRLALLRGALPTGWGATRLDAALRLNRHDDDFILDRQRPEWYRNRHRSEGLLASLGLAGERAAWRWAGGVEGASEKLDSTNLGRRDVTRWAGYGELAWSGTELDLAVQARLDDQDEWGAEPTWGVGGGWRPAPGWRLRAHLGSSFRAPSFTDLYYVSPSTVGNPELQPEEGRSGEVGLDHGPLAVTLFARVADPVIDYLLGDDGVWRADTAGRVTSRGLELALALPTVGRLRWQRLGGVWLDSELDVDPTRSRYALAHPEAELAWSGLVELGAGFSGGWAARWRRPTDQGSWATLDLRLARRCGDVALSLEAANLFDRAITEVNGVPLPGRWVSVTAAWRPSDGR